VQAGEVPAERLIKITFQGAKVYRNARALGIPLPSDFQRSADVKGSAQKIANDK